MTLPALLRKLKAAYGRPAAPPLRDPYLLLLFEQVGYLAGDADRLAAFRLLESRVGTGPDEILAAGTATLRAIVRRGGAIAVAERAERLRTVAELVLARWNGTLRPVLRLPLDQARRELAKFPSIGEAGAERILLLAGSHAVLGLDSNALRVLLRLGYGKESREWKRSYRSAQAEAAGELPGTPAPLRSAYLLLKHHGQTLCRRSAPRCRECPLQAECPTGRRML